MRNEQLTGDITMSKERSYGLSAEEVTAMKAEYKESKCLPNPYRQKGAYRFTIGALVALGTDKFHPLSMVYSAFKEAAGDEWYSAWANKEARTGKGKDAPGKFLLNLHVLQRTKDYAKRLFDLKRVLGSQGVVIDLSRAEDGTLLVRLNLDSASPEKPGRRLTETAPPKVAKTQKPKKRSKGSQNAHKSRRKTMGQKAKPKARKPQK
jgi:hypothetical protein